MKKTSKNHRYRVYAGIFILAFGFWLLVKMNDTYDYAIEVPLKITQNNPDMCLTYPTPSSVLVEFQGRGMDLLKLSFSEPSYDIDLSAEQHDFTLRLTDHHEYVQIPGGLEMTVKSVVRPHEIIFDLDRRLAKKVPVTVRGTVDTEDGFTLVNTLANPDSIMIAGPAVYVDTLNSIATVVKHYDAASQPFQDALVILKNEKYYGEYRPGKVTAFYDIQRIAEKDIQQVPVTVINVPDNYEVVPLPSTVTVYVKGGEKILAEANRDDFQVIIDYKKDWQPGAKRVSATIKHSISVLYKESIPPQFELIVQKNRR